MRNDSALTALLTTLAGGLHGNFGSRRVQELVRGLAPSYLNALDDAEQWRICSDIIWRVQFVDRRRFFVQKGHWALAGPRATRRIVLQTIHIACQDPQVIAEAERMRVSVSFGARALTTI